MSKNRMTSLFVPTNSRARQAHSDRRLTLEALETRALMATLAVDIEASDCVAANVQCEAQAAPEVARDNDNFMVHDAQATTVVLQVGSMDGLT